MTFNRFSLAWPEARQETVSSQTADVARSSNYQHIVLRARSLAPIVLEFSWLVYIPQSSYSLELLFGQRSIQVMLTYTLR